MNKTATTIEQSCKLAEILPTESADMWWNFYSVTTNDTTPQIIHLDTPLVGNFNWDNKPDNIPCWSLAALLNIINKDYYTSLFHDGVSWTITITHHDDNKNRHSVWFNEPLDACFDMILLLYDKNLI